MLAALAIERATGEPYAAFARRRIFEPLGMASTSAGIPLRTPVRGHAARKRADAPALAKLPGAGDVWSTVDDLARYAAALDAGDLLSDESLRLATTVHSQLPAEIATSTNAVKDDGYGYGYVIGTLLGHCMRYHSGDNPGFRTLQARLPDIDVSVVILSNQDETDIEAAALRVFTHVGDALR